MRNAVLFLRRLAHWTYHHFGGEDTARCHRVALRLREEWHRVMRP